MTTSTDHRTARAGTTERAHAAMTGLALGDALGMPTQSMSRRAIAEDHGVLTGLVDAGPRQRIAAGMPAGSVTDDTEQAVLVARLLVEGEGTVDLHRFARELLEWERAMEAKGSLDLLGPSTRAAVAHIVDGGSVETAGATGTTNGAAMRITPVGIATPCTDLALLVDAVHAVSRLTHDTGLGIAGASAVAAAVSAGLDGADRDEALDVAVAAARLGADRGNWVAGGDIAARLAWARPHLRTVPATDRLDVVADVIGTSVASQESVVAALALVGLGLDPWETLCVAAGLGGDTDTVAAIAGAVLGAVEGPAAFPADAVETLRRVNDLDPTDHVDALLALRAR